MSKTPTKSKKTYYELVLEMAGGIFKSKGETVLEALQKLEHPDKLRHKGHITVSYGTKSKRLFFGPNKMKRLFYPKFQHIHAKWIGNGLK